MQDSYDANAKMETQSAIHPISRDRVSEKFSNRPRATTESWDASSPRTLDISHPANRPRGFESMLKTTTETGNIGMFSIKPSRIPQMSNTPRKSTGAYSDSGMQMSKQSFQSFQPYGVPDFDDRRCLPSYVGDFASNVTSMYEAANQKPAGQGFEEPDYRSYSMTQTLYPSYTLSNHKSYASLRGQQDRSRVGSPSITGLQRPKSPFAYPTRLRRPGFRPSSPALTDGGIVDYSRRVDIDRLTYSSDHSTSSPSSLYALKRKPLHTLRPDVNRSTPSLLSQPSPHRRSSSPQIFTNSGHDWSRRTGIASTNTSPAGSTFSISSTANLYASVSATATSAVVTPAKITPSSPLYYDYTEDFEIEDYRPFKVLPPPSFTIHKTIPEENLIHSSSLVTGVQASKTGYNNGPWISVPLSSETPISVIPPLILAGVKPVKKDVGTKEQPLHECTPSRGTLPSRQASSARVKKIIRLSGLGDGARELSSHVEEAFGLDPSDSFEVAVVHDTRGIVPTRGGNNHQKALNTSPESFPRRRTDLDIPTRGFTKQPQMVSGFPEESSRDFVCDPCCSDQALQEAATKNDEPAHLSAPIPRSRTLSTRFSFSKSFADATVTTIMVDSQTNEPDVGRLVPPPSEVASMNFPAKLEKPMSRSDSSHLGFDNQIYQIKSPRNSATYEYSHAQKPSQRHRNYQLGETSSSQILSEHRAINAPNFSYRMGRSVAQQGPPMIAPKPISPARQLRLKNSIPHLMKALPPLPLELNSQAPPPTVHLRLVERELPHHVSLELQRPAPEITHETRKAFVAKQEPVCKANVDNFDQAATYLVDVCASIPKGEENDILPPPTPMPRLKLKLRALNTLQTPSALITNDWNFGESSLLANKNTTNRSSPANQQSNNIDRKPPRFRLKVTRASLMAQGTVLIHRNPGDIRPAAGLQFRNPRDLFAPRTGIESVFRQVSKHIHSQRSSRTSSLQPLPESETTLGPSYPLVQKSAEVTSSQESMSACLAPPSNGPKSCEARSCFSEDSSGEEGENSLRRRLVNLRYKIAVPYVLRAGAQSHDEITWRYDNEYSTSAATRSIPNLHSGGNRTSTDAKSMSRFAEKPHRQKLKTKMHSWFKGARAVLAARARLSRSACSTTEVVEGDII